MTDSSQLPVTVIVAVRNEAANIERCLESLRQAEKVFVVDSNSTDGTTELARAMGAEVVQFQYDGGYPKKRQWMIDRLPDDSNWVMLVDADEVVPPALWMEVRRALDRRDGPTGYLVRKQFHFMGREFRHGGFSHASIFFMQRNAGRFEELVKVDTSGMDMEVHERVVLRSSPGKFKTCLIHEDRKGLKAYLARHQQYAVWESTLRLDVLKSQKYGIHAVTPSLFGDYQQRRRALKRLVMRLPFEALLWFVYHYFMRLGFLEGRRGLIASQIRMSYIQQVRALVCEGRWAARQ